MSALLGTFVSIKTMADGSPRITLDLQCTLAEAAALGLAPGAAFGIARITGESTVDHHHETVGGIGMPRDSEPKTPDSTTVVKPGQLCVMACTFCADPLFWKWISKSQYACRTEAHAKEWVMGVCGVESRKEIDADKIAATRFHTLIREPFMDWRDSQ